MNWERLTKEKKKTDEKDLELIEKKILFIVLKELIKFNDCYTISLNNNYGKWDII